MSFSDEVESEIRNYKVDSETTIGEIVARQSLFAAISTIPFAGSAMVDLFNDLAQRRAQDRLNRVLDQLKDSLRRLGEDKIDREYFRSEEFQTPHHCYFSFSKDSTPRMTQKN
jgi:hypothetical protein